MYTGLIAELDEALGRVASTDPVATNFLYAGENAENWIKFANAVKLKILMRMSNVQDVKDQVAALIAENNFPTEDVQWSSCWSNSAGAYSPLYGEDFAPGMQQNLILNLALEATMAEYEDARLGVYFSTNGNGEYAGGVSGTNFSTSANYKSDYWCRPNVAYNTPVSLISVAEVEFFLAEYEARYGSDAQAKAHYENAINASFAAAGVEGAAAAIAAYPWNKNDYKRIIGIQKWIALSGINNYEAWCEVRRLGYPAFGTVTGKQIYDEANDALIISSKAFSSAENMTPGNITAVILGALNGDCAWTINKVETLAGAPGTEVQGYENILNNEPAQVLLTDPFTAPAGQDSVGKVVANVNENIIAVTLTHTADQHRFYINMTGSCSGWDGGLGLRLGHEGMMLNLGGVNATELAQLNFYSLGAVGEEFTVAYKLSYLESNGKYYGVEIEIWAGPAGGTLTKVGAHEIKDSRVSYDSEKGAFILKYDIVDSPEKFAPDCTLAAMGAFNGGCEFTIVKVEILASAPGTEVQGYENILNSESAQVLLTDPFTAPAGQDSVGKVVANVNENIIAVTLTHTADQHRFYINMTGSCSGWDGGLGLRLGHEGMMLNLGGVNATELAQLNFYSLGAVGEEFTVAYKLSYLESNGKYYGVEIEIWAGPAGGTLTKVGAHEIKDSRVSYDSEKGAFILKYDIVDSPEMFAPDCTLAAMGAFNGGCEFTITKVEILSTEP